MWQMKNHHWSCILKIMSQFLCNLRIVFFSTTKFAWGFVQSLKEVAKIVAGEEPMVTAASAGAFEPLL